jgi:hypothetical protein
MMMPLSARDPAGVVDGVDDEVRLPTDASRAGQLLDLVARVPHATRGRDEQQLGEMWNSNSLLSWLLASSGPRPDEGCPALRRPRSRLGCWAGAGKPTAAAPSTDQQLPTRVNAITGVLGPMPRPRPGWAAR